MEGGFRVKIEEMEEEIRQRRRKMEATWSKKILERQMNINKGKKGRDMEGEKRRKTSTKKKKTKKKKKRT